tara:strand:- start:1142 stop:1414 length:273 start_codon:yes stop_codon:yes gene_type:complete
MSLYLEQGGRGLCWDTVMHFMGYDRDKWECLRTVRYMMNEGYCRQTMTALFEDACDRWSMGHDTQDILKWLRDPDYVFPEESSFWEGDVE